MEWAGLHVRNEETGRPIRPAAHHWLWLTLMCDPTIQRLLITAPPESAKTTWAMAYLATSIGYRPERPRIIASSTGAVATRRSLAVRTAVDGEAYRETFPGVERAKGLQWEAHGWSVAPGGRAYPGRIHPTLSAYGTDGPVTGSRAAEIVADDLLDERNTRTPYQRGLVYRWIHNSLLSRVMAQVGRVIVIGTVWRHDDPYDRLKRLPGWVWCNIPMLSDGPEVRATIYYPPDHPGQRLGQVVQEDGLQEEVAHV